MSAFRPTALPPAHSRLLPERQWPFTGGWRCPNCDNVILHRSPGHEAPSWERCRGKSTIRCRTGYLSTPGSLHHAPRRAGRAWASPWAALAPEKRPRRGSSLSPAPGLWGVRGDPGMGLGEARREGAGRVGRAEPSSPFSLPSGGGAAARCLVP